MLVTGGAGFIGANFVHYALRVHPAWELVVLDKLTYAGNLANLAGVMDRIRFVKGDIASAADVAGAMAGCDAVVNFAAESHVDRSLVDSHPFLRTNVEGTLVLLTAARELGVRRFLQISTDEIYGDLAGHDGRSREDDAARPRSPYAATKAAAEHLAFAFHTSYGLDVVVTRGSNNFGPYQYPEKIIPLFITNAIDGKPLPLYNDGSAVRDYMHVEDHCAGIDLVLHEGRTGTAYNLGAGAETSGVAVAEAILKALGRGRELITFVADRPGHDYRYAMDVTRAEALGWRRRHNFADGLAATVRWYRDNEPWWRQVKQKLEYVRHEQSWYKPRP
ncbi:MAG: dTDP-glucose 4,6-dehydratase [Planctomycetes bacterium]|nr:dTDP-glucose 4,6-dehydratase [Planctomycetota bacterium]